MDARPEVFDTDPGRRQMAQLLALSRRRSADLGSGQDDAHLPPAVLDDDGLEQRLGHTALISLLPTVRGLLEPAVAAEGDLLAVADADGVLLWVGGDDATARRIGRLNFRPGADWSEARAGTNAPGTALATARPVQVIGREHWNSCLATWSCVAAPVRDPDDGRLIGAIDVTGGDSLGNPLALALVRTVTRTLEDELRRRRDARDALVLQAAVRRVGGDPDVLLLSPGGRVLRAPAGLGVGHRLGTAGLPDGSRLLIAGRPATLERLTPDGYLLAHLLDPAGAGPGRPATAPDDVRLHVLGTSTATLTVDGRTIRFTPRHSEILFLLANAPAGMSAGRLAVELSGEERSTTVVRAEMARLRRLVGPLLESQPYRLTRPVRTDAREVADLVARGRPAQALAGYPGPLLNDSEAPGVVDQRVGLEQQVRGAVLAAGDPALLRRWLDGVGRRAGAQDDVEAWAALARLLPAASPQRAAAAARAQGLDRALAATPSLPRRP